MGRQSVLITGASTGIGAASAIALAQQGWRVFAGVRNPAAGEALAARGDVTPVQLDVTDCTTIAVAARRIEREVGADGLTALVNNAGIAVGGPLEAVPVDQLRRQLDVNVAGTVAVTQAMLPLLRTAAQANGIARIVIISSVSGLVSFPYLAPYAASKHALEAIGDAWRVELARWSIRISLVEPGPVATPIWTKAQEDAARQVSAWPERMHELYPDFLLATQAIIAKEQQRAVPVDEVVKALRHALTASRPRPRYPVGAGSRIARIRHLVPDRLWDRLVQYAISHALANQKSQA